ncbi:MAG: peptidoglycan DD-metalloendopeptidase family protein, partial [Candidatus Omnitrophica bacterium]|nr:peptidoglycan DD-metalloendopeptidase family protein [Candidatus Omnitrophota bacterium]
ALIKALLFGEAPVETVVIAREVMPEIEAGKKVLVEIKSIEELESEQNLFIAKKEQLEQQLEDEGLQRELGPSVIEWLKKEGILELYRTLKRPKQVEEKKGLKIIDLFKLAREKNNRVQHKLLKMKEIEEEWTKAKFNPHAYLRLGAEPDGLFINVETGIIVYGPRKALELQKAKNASERQRLFSEDVERKLFLGVVRASLSYQKLRWEARSAEQELKELIDLLAEAKYQTDLGLEVSAKIYAMQQVKLVSARLQELRQGVELAKARLKQLSGKSFGEKFDLAQDLVSLEGINKTIKKFRLERHIQDYRTLIEMIDVQQREMDKELNKRKNRFVFTLNLGGEYNLKIPFTFFGELIGLQMYRKKLDDVLSLLLKIEKREGIESERIYMFDEARATLGQRQSLKAKKLVKEIANYKESYKKLLSELFKEGSIPYNEAKEGLMDSFKASDNLQEMIKKYVDVKVHKLFLKDADIKDVIDGRYWGLRIDSVVTPKIVEAIIEDDVVIKNLNSQINIAKEKIEELMRKKGLFRAFLDTLGGFFVRNIPEQGDAFTSGGLNIVGKFINLFRPGRNKKLKLLKIQELEMAIVQFDALKKEREDSLRDTVAEKSLLVMNSQKRMAIVTELIEKCERNLELLKARQKAGDPTLKEMDLIGAEIIRQEALIWKIFIEEDIGYAILDLKDILGLKPDTLLEGSFGLSKEYFSKEMVEKFVSRIFAEESHYGIVLKEKEAVSEIKRLQLERARLGESIIKAGISLQSGLWLAEGIQWRDTVAAVLSISPDAPPARLWGGDRKKVEVAVAEWAYKVAKQDLQKTKLFLEHDLRQRLWDIDYSSYRLDHILRRFNLYKDELEIAKERFKVGYNNASYNEVVIAELDYLKNMSSYYEQVRIFGASFMRILQIPKDMEISGIPRGRVSLDERTVEKLRSKYGNEALEVFDMLANVQVAKVARDEGIGKADIYPFGSFTILPDQGMFFVGVYFDASSILKNAMDKKAAEKDLIRLEKVLNRLQLNAETRFDVAVGNFLYAYNRYQLKQRRFEEMQRDKREIFNKYLKMESTEDRFTANAERTVAVKVAQQAEIDLKEAQSYLRRTKRQLLHLIGLESLSELELSDETLFSKIDEYRKQFFGIDKEGLMAKAIEKDLGVAQLLNEAEVYRILTKQAKLLRILPTLTINDLLSVVKVNFQGKFSRFFESNSLRGALVLYRYDGGQLKAVERIKEIQRTLALDILEMRKVDVCYEIMDIYNRMAGAFKRIEAAKEALEIIKGNLSRQRKRCFEERVILYNEHRLQGLLTEERRWQEEHVKAMGDVRNLHLRLQSILRFLEISEEEFIQELGKVKKEEPRPEQPETEKRKPSKTQADRVIETAAQLEEVEIKLRRASHDLSILKTSVSNPGELTLPVIEEEMPEEVIYHDKGIHIILEKDNRVFSSAPGSVVFAGRLSGYGKTVIVDHGGLKTIYGHLDRLEVEKGALVQRAQLLGRIDITEGAPLNYFRFEVKKPDDTTVEPSKYLWKGIKVSEDIVIPAEFQDDAPVKKLTEKFIAGSLEARGFIPKIKEFIGQLRIEGLEMILTLKDLDTILGESKTQEKIIERIYNLLQTEGLTLTEKERAQFNERINKALSKFAESLKAAKKKWQTYRLSPLDTENLYQAILSSLRTYVLGEKEEINLFVLKREILKQESKDLLKIKEAKPEEPSIKHVSIIEPETEFLRQYVTDFLRQMDIEATDEKALNLNDWIMLFRTYQLKYRLTDKQMVAFLKYLTQPGMFLKDSSLIEYVKGRFQELIKTEEEKLPSFFGRHWAALVDFNVISLLKSEKYGDEDIDF